MPADHYGDLKLALGHAPTKREQRRAIEMMLAEREKEEAITASPEEVAREAFNKTVDDLGIYGASKAGKTIRVRSMRRKAILGNVFLATAIIGALAAAWFGLRAFLDWVWPFAAEPVAMAAPKETAMEVAQRKIADRIVSKMASDPNGWGMRWEEGNHTEETWNYDDLELTMTYSLGRDNKPYYLSTRLNLPSLVRFSEDNAKRIWDAVVQMKAARVTGKKK